MGKSKFIKLSRLQTMMALYDLHYQKNLNILKIIIILLKCYIEYDLWKTFQVHK